MTGSPCHRSSGRLRSTRHQTYTLEDISSASSEDEEKELTSKSSIPLRKNGRGQYTDAKGNPIAPDEAKRIRKRATNRESARRMRLFRKQEHDDLQQEVHNKTVELQKVVTINSKINECYLDLESKFLGLQRHNQHLVDATLDLVEHVRENLGKDGGLDSSKLASFIRVVAPMLPAQQEQSVDLKDSDFDGQHSADKKKGDQGQRQEQVIDIVANSSIQSQAGMAPREPAPGFILQQETAAGDPQLQVQNNANNNDLGHLETRDSASGKSQAETQCGSGFEPHDNEISMPDADALLRALPVSEELNPATQLHDAPQLVRGSTDFNFGSMDMKDLLSFGMPGAHPPPHLNSLSGSGAFTFGNGLNSILSIDRALAKQISLAKFGSMDFFNSLLTQPDDAALQIPDIDMPDT